MDDPLLVVDDLCVSYGSVTAVRALSCVVARGEIVSILGTNGAGKSSTLKALIGLVRPSSGRVLFGPERRDIAGRSPNAVVRLGVALVPEGRRMLADMTVDENLAIGAVAAGKKAMSLDEVFSVFPRLRARRRTLAGNLSGGEQQMLAIGRALISRPELLLMDEPSLGLAPALAKDVYSVVSELNRNGVSVLLVDQNISQALEISQRYYVMRSGSVVATGAADDPDLDLDRLGAQMGLTTGPGAC